MKRGVKKVLLIIQSAALIILILLVALFLIRLMNPTEIDDITPGIPCPEIEVYNPDILYVIPDYNKNPISEDKEWCDYIISLNKTLGLHGITHAYREFLYSDISQERLDSGILEFKKCFGYKPEAFKSPQLKTSPENKHLIKQNDLEFRTLFDQITHKVYHCSDSATPHNNLIKIF